MAIYFPIFSVKFCNVSRLSRTVGSLGMKTFPGIVGDTFRLLDGHNIPLIGLGTYELWNQKEVDIAVNAALENGYRLFDTANFYANEKELGNAFAKLLPKHGLTREDIFITTKANMRSSDIEQNAKVMVEHSLRCLQTNYLDLVLIHYPKDWSKPDEYPGNKDNRKRMYKVLEAYKDAGKVRSIGVSNYEGRHIDEIWEDAKHRPVVNQCEFHPHLTRPDVVKYCKEKGIFFQAHTSLAKMSSSLYKNPELKKIAEDHNVSIPVVLLAFAYQQNVGVIPKSKDPKRIADNIKLMTEIALSEEELETLNGLNRDHHYSDCDGWNVL